MPSPPTVPRVTRRTSQSTHTLCMVSPANQFQYNTATATDNVFMQGGGAAAAGAGVIDSVTREFWGVVACLEAAGVRVHVFAHGQGWRGTSSSEAADAAAGVDEASRSRVTVTRYEAVRGAHAASVSIVPHTTAPVAAAEAAARSGTTLQDGEAGDVGYVTPWVVPDTLFPNNWLSTHTDDNAMPPPTDGSGGRGRAGPHRRHRVCWYPMRAENRRRERCQAIRQGLLHRLMRGQDARGDHVYEILDWTPLEGVKEGAVEAGLWLEGTGSLVLDRLTRTAYLACSPRGHVGVATAWCKALGYTLQAFPTHMADAREGSGVAAGRSSGKGAARAADGSMEWYPVYHTNVVMAIGTRWALWCPGVIPDSVARHRIHTSLTAQAGAWPKRSVIEITVHQVRHYCGNVLEVRSAHDTEKVFIVASRTAWHAFDEAQRDALRACVDDVLVVDVSTIERIAGGGVRCMLAELFT